MFNIELLIIFIKHHKRSCVILWDRFKVKPLVLISHWNKDQCYFLYSHVSELLAPLEFFLFSLSVSPPFVLQLFHIPGYAHCSQYELLFMCLVVCLFKRLRYEVLWWSCVRLEQQCVIVAECRAGGYRVDGGWWCCRETAHPRCHAHWEQQRPSDAIQYPIQLQRNRFHSKQRSWANVLDLLSNNSQD